MMVRFKTDAKAIYCRYDLEGLESGHACDAGHGRERPRSVCA
jgi:hypothetical protein